MKVVTVDCNSCGAPLEVGEKTRFVTCRYCSKRLSIQHSESSVYTEVLDDIKESTDKISQDMEVIKLQNQLEQLDREWMLQRESFMISSKNGGKHLPTGGSAIGGIFAAAFGVVWIVFASSMGAPAIFPLFGVFFIIFAVFGAVNTTNKATSYRNAHQRYQAHRRELQHRLSREESR
jgi:preprotein translocase subunit SecF